MKQYLKHIGSQQGFTLIEVMVALVVLSIGLLGMAAMQISSLQANREAYIRTQAVIATYEIIDRIRANPEQLASYATGKGDLPGAAVNCEGASVTCSAAQMVGYDLGQWKCGLGKWNSSGVCGSYGITGDLSGGDGSVVVNGSSVSVTVFYEDQQGTEQSFTVGTEL